MNVVAVMNYKGGVGKTTVTANLGAALALRGKRVLLIDVDPQTSLTFCFMGPNEWREQIANEFTIRQWFEGILSDEPVSLSSLCLSLHAVDARVPTPGKLNLISSHLDLINVDMELASQLGGATERIFTANYLKVHGQLQRALADLKGSYDFVLIDCPPNFNVITKNAIVASDFMLIPAKPDYLSTLGIEYLTRSVNGLIKEYNVKVTPTTAARPANPRMLGVVFTMIQYSSGTTPIMAQQQFIDQVREESDMPVFKTYVRLNNTKFGDSGQSGLPYVLSKDSDPLGKSIVLELKALGDEFLKATETAGGTL